MSEKTKSESSKVKILIQLTLLFCIFCYFAWFGRWSFYRLFHSVIDLGLSIAKYFLEIFFIDSSFLPETITKIPEVPFVPFLPLDSSELSGFWGRFFPLLIDGENFLTYAADFGNVTLTVYRLLIPFIALFIAFRLRLSQSAEDENNDFGKKSRGVIFAEKIILKVAPVVRCIAEFFRTLPFWWCFTTALVALAGTNLLTVCVELLSALLFYSVSGWQLIYTQIYKLFLDFTISWHSLPVPLWIVLFYILFCIIRRLVAFSRLEKMEKQNRQTLENLPLCVLITGKIGVGKTMTNVNLSLSMQDLMRDRMRDAMFRIQAEFPEYPWEYLDRQIAVMFAAGDLQSKVATRRIFKELFLSSDLSYGYDGKMSFTDGVTVSYLVERIVDYAELQYMYRVQCLISSSYSIRVDSVFTDKGKMPSWRSDYFRSPPFDPASLAQRTHILDFDTLRLGKTVSQNVSTAGAWEFGILSHTEMGKDFGNSLTNKDLKATDARANIKNDMLIDRIKVLRHSSTANYIPYCQYIGDEQRPSSLGADALELCDVLQLRSSSGSKTAIRLLLVERFFCELIFSIWNNWYSVRRVNRADTDLAVWTLRKLIDKVYPWYTEKLNRFGFEVIDAKVLDGADVDGKDGAPVVQIYSCYKKTRSRRYATDCFAAVLASRTGGWSLDSSPVYEKEVASTEEIRAQHSYFGNRILNVMRGENDDSE